MSVTGIVYVVDDDSAFRRALTRALTAAGLNVHSHASGPELLERLFSERAAKPSGCVLADLRMPGMDGLQLQRACTQAGFELPFVFLTGEGDVPSAVAAMQRGAVDFLEKCAPLQTLLCAVERAFESNAKARAARSRQEHLERLFGTLTARERDVLQHVVRGRLNKQIAAALGIHERTVKLHRHAITTKLQVRRVAELTALAQQVGLLAEQPAMAVQCPRTGIGC